MKHLLTVLMLLFASPANADYFGTTYGKTILNYDLRGDAYEWLIKDGKEYSSAVNLLGGNINVDATYQNSMNKIFYGYEFTKHFSLEVFYIQMQPFSLSASANVNPHLSTHVGGGSSVINGDTYLNANFNYNASIDLKGFGLKLVGTYPILNRISMIAGIGVMKGESTIKTSSSYNVDYGYDIVSPYDSLSDVRNLNESQNSQEEIDSWVPVIGAGMLYRVTKEFSIRTEFERYGHPIDKLSIDVISVGLQYNF